MMLGDDAERPGLYTLRRVAQALGISPENLKALERRGRLPEGCEPETDLATGTRYWTGEQVERLKEWNEQRKSEGEGGRAQPPGPEDAKAPDDPL